MAIDRSKKSVFRHLGRLIQCIDKRKVTLRVLDQDAYDLSIVNTRFAGSYPLMALCDVRPDRPQSSFIDSEYLNNLPYLLSTTDPKKIVSIYLCSDALIPFATTVLPKLKRQFILLSGDSDLEICSEKLKGAFDLILENPNLSAWFAQNKSDIHPKLYSLPIGLDFHSKWIEPGMWGHGAILPSMQELEMRLIFNKSPQWEHRITKAYCDWTLNIERGDRNECKSKVDPNACVFSTNALSRVDTWAEQSRYAFVVSPSGEGLDCHRTWEALALGCVPIVKNHLFTDLFRDLPVLVVNDWSEVTEPFLKEWCGKLSVREFNYSNLMLSQWNLKIHEPQIDRQILSKMTMNEFRTFICA
jgi:hypothetical protein